MTIIANPLKAAATVAEMLRVQQNEVQDLIGGRHWGAVGEHREELLRTVLDRALPARLQVSHGFIVARDGRASGQLDVVIWDKANHGPLFESGRFAIVPPRSVVAVVEVKTSLTKTKAREATESIRSAKALAQAASPPIFGAIVGYRSGTSFQELSQAVQEGLESRDRDVFERHAPDYIIALDRPMLTVKGEVRHIREQATGFGPDSQLTFEATNTTVIPHYTNYIPVTRNGNSENNLGPTVVIAQLLFAIDHFLVRARREVTAEIEDAPDIAQIVHALYLTFEPGRPLFTCPATLRAEERRRLRAAEGSLKQEMDRRRRLLEATSAGD